MRDFLIPAAGRDLAAFPARAREEHRRHRGRRVLARSGLSGPPGKPGRHAGGHSTGMLGYGRLALYRHGKARKARNSGVATPGAGPLPENELSPRNHLDNIFVGSVLPV
jgi:hypothetical protein